jgi:hypothetical protein
LPRARSRISVNRRAQYVRIPEQTDAALGFEFKFRKYRNALKIKD